ncbi:MAG: hypothetical protein ACI906_000437 [Candidatus Latescibacterota bacterium]|jgi:hypothetical protein
MKPKAILYIVLCALAVSLLATAPVRAAVTVEVANVNVASGASATVPISLTGVSPEQIVSVEVFLTYDPLLVTFDSLSTTGGLLDNWVLNNGFFVSVVVSGPALDTLKVAGVTTVDTLTADGVLFNLGFTMGTFYVPTLAALTLEHVLLNAGTPATTPVNGSLKITGIDGSISTDPQQTGSNGPIAITIIDADANRNGGSVENLLVTVSNNGDSESFTAVETGVASGQFEGSINAAFSPGFTVGDGTVQIQLGQQGSFCFDDSLDANGNTTQRCAATIFILGTLGTIEVTNAAQAADTLRVRVVDVDLNANTAQVDIAIISLVNNTTLESETIQLNETGDNTNIFVGRAFTVFGTGAGAVGDSALNIQRGDLVLADYIDLAAGTGQAENVRDTCQVLDPWGDASGNGQLRGFDAAEILAHVVGSATLTGLDSLSANVDDLAPFGQVTSFDASLVLQKRVGLIGHFPVQEKTSANHPQPESSSAPKILVVERSIELVGGEGYWTVHLAERDGIVAGEIFIRDFSGRVETEAAGFLVAWRQSEEGMRIALAGGRPLAGGGELLRLYGVGQTPRIESARFNDGRIVGRVNAAANAPRPQQFRLLPNTPNPFNPETLIRYELAKEGLVQLTVFNALGQKVRTLVQGAQVAGAHVVRWDGRDELGAGVGAGMYFYRLESGTFWAVHKMTLLK